MTDNTPTTTVIDETTQLTNLDGILSGMADPIARANDISYLLDALYDEGADAGVLEEVQVNVGALASMIQQYAQVTESLKALAEKIRDQRDAVRNEFEDLREAVEDFDQSHPAVEQLYEYVEMTAFEFLQMAFYEDFSNIVFDITPLEYTDIATLINLLTDRDETVPPDNPLWGELRDWLDRAEAAAMRLDGHVETEEANA
jgi:uncharacterized protein YukE